jgi:hypothetical protein
MEATDFNGTHKRANAPLPIHTGAGWSSPSNGHKLLQPPPPPRRMLPPVPARPRNQTPSCSGLLEFVHRNWKNGAILLLVMYLSFELLSDGDSTHLNYAYLGSVTSASVETATAMAVQTQTAGDQYQQTSQKTGSRPPQTAQSIVEVEASKPLRTLENMDPPQTAQSIVKVEASKSLRTLENMDNVIHTSCPAVQEKGVTLVMQTSVNCMWLLQEQCRRWKGPIVVVVGLKINEIPLVIDDCPQLNVVELQINDPELWPVNQLRNLGLDRTKFKQVTFLC